MVSDIISITSSGTNMDQALEQTAKVARFKDLSPKGALHLRLLAEEMMGMMRSITHEVNGRFWIEDQDENGTFRLHLKTETVMDAEKRRELLSASSSGQNEATRSLMGRLREFFFRGANEDIANYQTPTLNAGIAPGMPMTDWQWSMTRYRDTLSSLKSEKPEAAEAWDELEKSVVHSVADDVKISIKGWETEMILIKKLS